MRHRSALLVGTFMIIAAIGVLRKDEGTEFAQHTRTSRSHEVRTDETEPEPEIGDTFAFEAAARFNEGIVANVDAIDTSLTTILAGNVALLVLMIDKLTELARVSSAWAAALMGLSTLACISAYVIGSSIRASNRDGARPRTLIPDLISRRREGLADAVNDLIRAGEENLRLRSRKKGFAVLAIIFLLAGAVAIALARLNGNMVYSSP